MKMGFNKCGLLMLLLVASATDVLGLKITKFKVPEHHLIEGNKPNDLLLECEYEKDAQDEGVALKWFLNENMIFQWIPEKSLPQAFGEFRRNIDLPKTNDTQKPLRIKNPNFNFTGKYKCQISSFQTTVWDHGYVQIVDVSRAAVKLNHKISEENIDVECISTDSYPRPTLNFVVDADILPVQPTHTQRDDGHYDASFSASFKKNEILEKGNKFGCELIVGTNKYNVSRHDIFQWNGNNGCNRQTTFDALSMSIFTIFLSFILSQSI